MNLIQLFKNLTATRIVSLGSAKVRSALEYKVILTVDEYEELERMVKNAEKNKPNENDI